MKRIFLLLAIVAFCAYSKGEDDTIIKYLGKVKVGKAIEYKNLTIYPLIATKVLSTQHYTTMDEASESGWLKIKEIGSGEVNFVEVKNTGPQPVFLMTGEIISGAKQDRMLQEDVLMPAKSSWIRVPVFCVEHGRWTSVSPEFKSEGLVVPNALRQKAKMTESQEAVWDEIASAQDRMGITSGTGTIRANYEDEEVRKTVNEYVDKFEKIPDLGKTTIGVVVATGNRIICLDLFANNSLLGKLWKKLVKSYAMDALGGEKAVVTSDHIRNFLEALENARYISTGTPGVGALIKIESDAGRGAALVSASAVVHMDFFPTDGFIPDDELHLDIRRDIRLDD